MTWNKTSSELLVVAMITSWWVRVGPCGPLIQTAQQKEVKLDVGRMKTGLLWRPSHIL